MSPRKTVWLAKAADIFRNIRYLEFDNAIFDARVTGRLSIVRTNIDPPIGPDQPARLPERPLPVHDRVKRVRPGRHRR